MVHQIARWGRHILLKLKMIWRHWGVNTCSAGSLPVLCLRAITSPPSHPHRSVICVFDKNFAELAQNKNGCGNEPLARTCREASPPIRDDWMECVPLSTARTLHHFIGSRQHMDWHAYRNPTPPMPNIHKHAQIYTNSMQFYGIQMQYMNLYRGVWSLLSYGQDSTTRTTRWLGASAKDTWASWRNCHQPDQTNAASSWKLIISKFLYSYKI